jgi:WD40 repeat protein
MSVAFSHDDRQIVSASSDMTLRVWNSNGSGQPLVIRHNAFVNAAAFSPDDQHIVSVSYDRLVRIWNADGHGEPQVLQGHDDIPTVAGEEAFSPDGKRFVTSSGDGMFRIWNADGSGESLAMRASHEAINSASFSPDGRRIIATSMDGTVTIWSSLELPTDPDDPLLWSATTYCMPLDVRQRLLDFPEAQSRADLERCQRTVSRSLE